MPDTPWISGRKRKTLVAVALAMVLVYVGIALLTDAATLIDALKRLGFLGCGAVLALSATNYIARFERWKNFLGEFGRRLPHGLHFLYYMAGFAFTTSPAKAGEAFRSLYLRDHGVTYSESIAALFVERLLDLCAMIMLAGFIILDKPKYRILVLGCLLIVAAIITVVCLPAVPRLLDRLSTHSKGRSARIAVALANLLRSSRRLLHPRPLIVGILVGLAAWSMEGFGFGVICHGMQIEGSFWTFCGIYAISVLAGSAAFFLPAGIGGTELVMSTLLVEDGTPLHAAIIATLLCRLATLWFAVLLGIGAAATVELSARKMRGKPVLPRP